MADQYVAVQPDSTGKKIDASEIVVGSNTVERQRIVLADSSTANALATVKHGASAPVTTDDALVVAVSPNLGVVQGSPNSTANAWPTTLTDGTNTTAVKAASTAATASDSAAVVAISPNSMTAKGTQGSVALPTQDLKDAGRTYVTVNVDAQAGVTTEALNAATIQNKAGTTSTSTNFTVTSGKVFRITGFTVYVRGTTTTAGAVTARLRAAPSAIAATSPIVVSLGAGMPVATTTSGSGNALPISEGIELAAGIQYGITYLATTTACTVSVCVTGYEY